MIPKSYYSTTNQIGCSLILITICFANVCYGHADSNLYNSDSPVEHCDKSCLSHCRGSGPKGCEVCREGYVWDPDYGCLDIDECLELGYNPCPSNTFCVNNEGSHSCFECDKACDGCNGDGPDMCIKCAEDYQLLNGYCASLQRKKEKQQVHISRYGTYFGLCLATCIIFRNNMYIASVIGLAVATYIGVAEYTVGDAPPLNPLDALAEAQLSD